MRRVGRGRSRGGDKETYSFHSFRTIFRWEFRMFPTSNNQQYCHLSAFSCT